MLQDEAVEALAVPVQLTVLHVSCYFSFHLSYYYMVF